MTIDVEKWIGKPYHPVHFNCWTLVEQVLGLPDTFTGTAEHMKDHIREYKHLFQPVDHLYDGTIVQMGSKHVGILVGDSILHCELPSVKLESLESAKERFRYLSFWEYAPCKQS